LPDLIQRLQKGDRDAFNELVTQYEKQIINIAYGMLSDREDALDAAGEFINCLNGLYASARSRAGEFLELFPPEYCVEGAALSGDVCVIPVFIQGKELYFVVA